MRLQLEILLHPAARWGEDASLLVAAGGVASLLLQDFLRGIGTLGSSGIMVLGRQWPPPPLPPPCHTPPPPLLPPPAVPPAAAATIATPQIDLSDSDSNSSSDSSADDDSGSCVIVEPVGNKGKTSFVCLSGDIRRVMLDKVKANASKGNPNASSHEVAKTMLQSVWAISLSSSSPPIYVLSSQLARMPGIELEGW